jgi:predicted enzyme related to lactoylglutathione lyase
LPESTALGGNLEVGIVVRDLEAVTPFYRDGLGLPHVVDLPLGFGLMRRFACGDGIVKIVQLDDAPHTSNPPDGVLGGCTGARWFSVRVDDIEEALTRCEAAGARVVQPIQEWRNGSKLLIVEDPEGNCWVEVLERQT